LEVQLANAAAGRTVTTINLQDLNRSTIAKAMLDTGRELLAVLTEMSGPVQTAGVGTGQPPAGVVGGERRNYVGDDEIFTRQESRARHSIGGWTTLYAPGTFGGNSFKYTDIGAYLRLSQSPIRRVSMNLGWRFGNDYYVKGNEVYAAGFMEWHPDNSGKNTYLYVYGGPGVMLGTSHYTFTASNWWYDDYKESSFGMGAGGQAGVEFRAGWFELGFGFRCMGYMRFWGGYTDFRTLISFGPNIGITF
jgi:hypothetical protein